MVGILPFCANKELKWSRIGMITDCDVEQMEVFALEFFIQNSKFKSRLTSRIKIKEIVAALFATM